MPPYSKFRWFRLLLHESLLESDPGGTRIVAAVSRIPSIRRHSGFSKINPRRWSLMDNRDRKLFCEITFCGTKQRTTANAGRSLNMIIHILSRRVHRRLDVFKSTKQNLQNNVKVGRVKRRIKFNLSIPKFSK